MFAQIVRPFRSSNRIIFTAALLSLFILAACGSPAPAPAAESTQMEASATDSEASVEFEEAMAEKDDAGGEMAEAAEEAMDDSAMAESHAMTETVESDGTSEAEAAGDMDMAEAAAEEMPEEAMAEEAMAVDLPAWQQLALIDAA